MTTRLAKFYDFSLRNTAFMALLIVVVYLMAGTTYSFILTQELHFYDERLYYALAENVWNLGMFSSNGEFATAQRPPGWSFLFAPLVSLEYGIIYARILNFLMVGAAGLLGFQLLRGHDHPVAGIIYLVLLLFYPVAFFTSGTLYPQSFSIFLLGTVSYLLLSRSQSYGQLALAGLIYGLLLLVAPVFLALIPAFAWAVYLNASGAHVPPLRTFALFVLIAAVVTVPWTVRNYKVFDQFVFISANSGFMLILGNSENARYDLGPRTDIQAYKEYAADNSSNPAQYDKRLREQAIDWIVENPGRAAILYVQKFLNWFHFSNNLATESQKTLARDLILLVSFYPILFLAVWFLCFDRSKDFWGLKLYIFLLYLGGAAVYAIFFTRIRYRIPFDAMMIMLAALQVEDFWKGLVTRSDRQAVRSES